MLSTVPHTLQADSVLVHCDTGSFHDQTKVGDAFKVVFTDTASISGDGFLVTTMPVMLGRSEVSFVEHRLLRTFLASRGECLRDNANDTAQS